MSVELATAALLAPAISLVAMTLVPDGLAERRVVRFRQLVTRIAMSQSLISLTLLVGFAMGLVPAFSKAVIPSAAFGVHIDGISLLMLTLVSFVGWVICRFSVRYLDGEENQGRYYRWTAFTIGSVSLLVISGNLLMFVAFWVMTSLGLHRLLLHYGHRPAAKRAAWTKFGISRLGDAALAGAIVLIYSQFKTIHFADLFAEAQSAREATPAISAAIFLLVIGAITKSAQFPFHTWLPLTMETPTPVSALMHAGIVNAGGYLMIRTSPLLALNPTAMSVLALIGGFTACFGAVVMLTQTSVKRSLAYSTIAQMGFMMLQCGLGAFSAAMFHILAHSLYKAHAFLGSGSVLTQREATLGAAPLDRSASWLKSTMAGVMIVALFALAMAVFQIDLWQKPGGMLLGGVLCLALTYWVGQVMRTRSRGLIVNSFLIAGVLCAAYAGGYALIDTLIAQSLPALDTSLLTWPVAGFIGLAFMGLFLLQLAFADGQVPQWLRTWYVHASNGFYAENLVRRISNS